MSWPLLAAFGKLLQKKRELNKQKQKGTEGGFQCWESQRLEDLKR